MNRLSEKATYTVVVILIFLGSVNGQIVEYNGLLQVKGNRIVNQYEVPVSFAGNSFFWSNDGWGGERFYNASVVNWLKQDWRTSIIRASMGIEDPGGYLENREGNKAKLKTLVEAAIAADLYVLIDWHSHHAEDYQQEAIEFFQEMATTYGEYDNVLYEVYNEPLDVSWTNTVKPYAEAVIAAIRDIDPDNIIIVGSPEWSQKVDLVATDPITTYDNIAYTLHFYSIWHHQWLRDRATDALNSGIALFATEWGALGDSSNDPETEAWMQWCLDNQISHCNWAVNDKEEAWSIVKPGASTTGSWDSGDLTIAGNLVKDFIRNWPSTIEFPTSTKRHYSPAEIYPNPSTTTLTLSGIDQTQNLKQIKIYSLSGVLYLYKPGKQENTIDVRGLPPGLYHISIETIDGIYSARFIKN